jgi:hypothetical protein
MWLKTTDIVIVMDNFDFTFEINNFSFLNFKFCVVLTTPLSH